MKHPATPRPHRLSLVTLSACTLTLAVGMVVAPTATAPAHAQSQSNKEAASPKAHPTASAPAKNPAQQTKQAESGMPSAPCATLEGIGDREVLKRLLAFSRACSYGDIYQTMGVNMDDPISDADLAAVSPDDLKLRLLRLRQTYSNPATWQNVAINFTLAYFNLDYGVNLRALLRPYVEEIALLAPRPTAATRRWAALQKKAGDSLFEALAAPNLFLRLYEHNGDTNVLKYILAMRGIGGLGEASAEAQTTLLLAHPREVVNALAH